MKQAVCFFHQLSGGKILAVSRRGRPTEFGLPGGKVDPGETLGMACRRELFEETGLSPQYGLFQIYRAECSGDVDYETTVFGATYGGPLDGVITPEPGCVVAYVDPQVLLDGPFGKFNRLFFDARYV